MKLQFVIWCMLVAVASQAQQNQFDFSLLKFKGLEFSTTKSAITKVLGEAKQVDTKYECGFFSKDQPDGPFYQLAYTGFTFIGGDKGKFFLETIDFDQAGKLELYYRGKKLSGLTTVAEFVNIFGEKAKDHFDKHPDKHALILHSKDNEGGGQFTFRDGRLVKFEYWTPC